VYIGMKKLPQAVNPCVGSAAAYNLYFFAQQFRKGVFYHLLHPNGVGLILPAVVRSAIVGDFEEVTHR
jgi:hypothetical protein